MVYLNFTNLDEETQERLLQESREDILSRNGKQLKQYAKENDCNFEQLLYEETVRNLYSYDYIFNI